MRKRIIYSALTIFMILIAMLIFVKFIPKEDNLKNKDNSVILNQQTKIFEEKINNLSAWVVYWDLNTDKEFKALDKELKNVSYFAVNFNYNNELTIPEKLISYYNDTKNNNYNKYITIVNDKIDSNGKSLLKDVNLLKYLLSNSTLRNNHIEDIINLAVKYDFDGIEIDYEQIKNDIILWNDYILFIKELYEKAQEKGLKLRIVLEPNSPITKLNFPEGPAYVIMCYNLHGTSTEPGEKANPEFINDLIKKMGNIPGKKDFAIATGGFDWADNGKTTSVTEIEANRILKEYGAKAERDVNSQCLFFNYKDINNTKHQIWYADNITLKFWMKTIIEKGYDVSIWRLGGNLFKFK